MIEKVTTYSQQGARTLLAIMVAVFALVAACTLAPVQKAWAETGTVVVHYESTETGEPIEGLQVNAYRIASIEGDSFVIDENFSGFANFFGWTGGTTAVSSDPDWLATQAKTMDAYIRAGGPDPVVSGVTGPDGMVELSGIEEGLVLVLPIGDGVHKFTSTLVQLDETFEYFQAVKPKVEKDKPTREIKVVKHWKGDAGKEAKRPQSIQVQLVCDEALYGEPVELSDANGWSYTWKDLDDSAAHLWNVVEVDVPAGYTVSFNESGKTIFVTNTYKPTEVIISKQEVGGGPELPGATLIVKDLDGNEIDKWVSTDTPHKLPLDPGIYTLTEITAPEGYEIAETITFRVNEDGTTDVLQDGEWVDAKNHVVMFDAKKGTPPTPTTTPSTPTATPTVTGKLPQTGQLWWPVPVMFCAGLIAIGAGRIVSHRSRAR